MAVELCFFFSSENDETKSLLRYIILDYKASERTVEVVPAY